MSILGFENCQSFFSATAHVRCAVPATPTPRGRCHSAYSIFYWQNDYCDRHQPITCEQLYKKHDIVTFFYIKLVVYKRSRKSRGIGDLKQNPWNPIFFFVTELFARHDLRQPVTMTGWRVARIDVVSHMNEVKAESASTWYSKHICLEFQSSIRINYKVTGLQSLEKLYHTRFLLRNVPYHVSRILTIWSRKLKFWICSFG